MNQESNYPPRMYWREAWQNRVKARFFSPYRAIPTVAASILQFVWKHNANTPFKEMWIAVAIIVGVYLTLFILESLWKLTVLTPPKIYDEQIQVIQEYIGKLGALEEAQRVPQISPQEQRRRQLVSARIRELGEIGRHILRCVADHGEIKVLALNAEYDFGEAALNGFLQRAIPGALVMHENGQLSLNPELKPAIEFVLASDFGKD